MAAPGARLAASATKVKNKQPAAKQITAEQLVREAVDLQEEEFRAPKQLIASEEELAEFRLRKRKEFEDYVRLSRWKISEWVKYANFEERQKDYARARSVWERTLEVDHRNVSIWLKYAEMEMRAKFINHARNVWDRAVSLLPRVDQLWYKYIHMEEMLGNVAGARQIYERWMKWEPDHQGWRSYIKMELRYGEEERARGIYERYVMCHPSVDAWVHYARFEKKAGNTGKARAVYERAVEMFAEDADEELFVMFAQFEEICKEFERARCIYKYALDSMPTEKTGKLYMAYVQFEKQHGEKDGIEDVVTTSRREQYEAQIREDPLVYDTWFDYCKLEEGVGDAQRVHELYERAVANVPPAAEKRFWQRYIYLWIRYALYEEVDQGDMERARAVYASCLKLIPHARFSFSKIWILAAKLELRRKDLAAARKLLGNALGRAPKEKLFRYYIDMEMQMGNVDRCRKLYERYLEWNPTSNRAWIKFTELEHGLGELDRCRAIFELAIDQASMDFPEAVWKAYIDMEMSEGERSRARQLYERLLSQTEHLKVWMSYAQFEAAAMTRPLRDDEITSDEDEGKRVPLEGEDETPSARGARARNVYERGCQSLRRAVGQKEACVMLLEAWRAFEKAMGSARGVKEVELKMPQRVKRKREAEADRGRGDANRVEEYYDYIFPDESAAAAPKLKLLEMAYKWKRQREEQEETAADAGTEPGADASEQQQENDRDTAL